MNKQFFKGVAHGMSVGLGYLPISASFGALAIQAKISWLTTVAMSLFVFAGASQFVALEGLSHALSWLSIAGSMLFINLRHIAMGLSIHRQFFHFKAWQRWLLAFGLTDETFALDRTVKTAQPWTYYLGIHVCCWSMWVMGTVLGATYGMNIPPNWLRFAVPSLFLCLLVEFLHAYQKNGSMLVLLVISTGVVVVSENFGSLGILISVIMLSLFASFTLVTAHPVERNLQ